MLGETEENWRACVERTLELEPDSVTIYQMELPFNTTISRDLLKGTGQFSEPVASWATKRRWVDEAFEALERAGYHVGSAYTAVKDPSRPRASSTAIASGRAPTWSASASRRSATSTASTCRTWTRGRPGQAAIERGELPLGRAYRPTDEERMIREFVLQLKRGALRPDIFRREVRRRSARPVSRRSSTSLAADGYLTSAFPRAAGAHPRRRCCASTSCCRASSCPSTPAFATRNEDVTPIACSRTRCCATGIADEATSISHCASTDTAQERDA